MARYKQLGITVKLPTHMHVDMYACAAAAWNYCKPMSYSAPIA